MPPPSRTAIGLAVNLPQFRYNDTYQFQNTSDVRARQSRDEGGIRRPPPVCEELLLPDDPRPAPLLDAQQLRRTTWRKRRTSTSRCPAARKSTTTAGGISTTSPRTSGESGRSLTLNLGLRYELNGQQHPEPHRSEPEHSCRQRQQSGFRARARAVDRQEQLPAANRIQLVAAHRHERADRA